MRSLWGWYRHARSYRKSMRWSCAYAFGRLRLERHGESRS